MWSNGNSTLEVVYESSVPIGDTSSFVSSANLLPDTEYTILASANYKLNDVDYNKIFVSKNTDGFSIERSTCDSAAKFIIT